MNYVISIQYLLFLRSLFCTEAFFPCTKYSPLKSIPAVFHGQGRLFITKALKDGNNNGNGEDFDGFSNDEMEAANDLAKEFYQQMKQREQQKESPVESKGETWEMKRRSSSIDNSTEQEDEKRRKYTGRFSRGDLDSTGTPSAGLFATQNGTVYAMPAPRRINIGSTASSRNNDRLSPREQMMRREFNLVSLASNELTLIVQGVLVMIILSFAIYIGATGGITDGSDRFGAGEGYVNEYNGMGESLDFSSYMNDDASRINSEIKEGMKENKDSSVWL